MLFRKYKKQAPQVYQLFPQLVKRRIVNKRQRNCRNSYILLPESVEYFPGNCGNITLFVEKGGDECVSNKLINNNGCFYCYRYICRTITVVSGRRGQCIFCTACSVFNGSNYAWTYSRSRDRFCNRFDPGNARARYIGCFSGRHDWCFFSRVVV